MLAPRCTLPLHSIPRTQCQHVLGNIMYTNDRCNTPPSAIAHGQTLALYRIEALIGPRPRDGRYAFEYTEVASGDLYERWIGWSGKTASVTSLLSGS